MFQFGRERTQMINDLVRELGGDSLWHRQVFLKSQKEEKDKSGEDHGKATGTKRTLRSKAKQPPKKKARNKKAIVDTESEEEEVENSSEEEAEDFEYEDSSSCDKSQDDVSCM